MASHASGQRHSGKDLLIFCLSIFEIVAEAVASVMPGAKPHGGCSNTGFLLIYRRIRYRSQESDLIAEKYGKDPRRDGMTELKYSANRCRNDVEKGCVSFFTTARRTFCFESWILMCRHGSWSPPV